MGTFKILDNFRELLDDIGPFPYKNDRDKIMALCRKMIRQCDVLINKYRSGFSLAKIPNPVSLKKQLKEMAVVCGIDFETDSEMQREIQQLQAKINWLEQKEKQQIITEWFDKKKQEQEAYLKELDNELLKYIEYLNKLFNEVSWLSHIDR